jgi:hypothetical protein
MHATCSIKDGIVTCTCKEYYYGDGESCVDPCKQRQCPVHSYCFRGLNGQAKCICEPGYTPDEGCEKADEGNEYNVACVQPLLPTKRARERL